MMLPRAADGKFLKRKRLCHVRTRKSTARLYWWEKVLIIGAALAYVVAALYFGD